MRRGLCPLAVVALSVTLAFAQDAGLKSGPQPEAVLPDAFDAFVINGKTAPGRQHCLICENALSPAVLVFAREPLDVREGEIPVNPSVAKLMTKLDEALATHEPAMLGGFVVFLNPDARSSVTDTDNKDVAKILEEARKRDALFKRLKKVAEPLKNVVIAAHPEEGPKGYQLNPKAEVTVIFFQNLKVIANWTFEPKKLTEQDADAIVKKIDEKLGGSEK